MKKQNRHFLAGLLIFAMLITGINFGNISNAAYAATVPSGATVVLACSDYQHENTTGKNDGNELNAAFCKTLFSTVQNNGYSSIDGFLCAGDYDVDLTYTVANTSAGLTSLKNSVEGVFGTGIDEVFIQGNHDSEIGTAGMSASGNNDPASGKYGVFVINEDDYMWYGSDEARVKQTAANLKSYLDEKRNAGFSAPIFVISHLPLHYSMRTYNDGDGRYANYLFDVMNEGGNAGLNIIYLYGHDHSNGWDDYLGGAAVYLAKGSSINIAQASKTSYKAETLAFTYMNAGYVGYYKVCNTGVDSTLTSSVFTITDDTVTVERYGTDGLHNLKAAGVANSYKKESSYVSYKPDTTTVASPQTIALNKSITPASGTGTDPGENQNGRKYERITSVDEIQDGDQVLMIYNGTKFMLPTVVTKSGTSGSRTGFDLETTTDFGSDVVYGEYESKEWTFKKSDSGWLIGASDNGVQKWIKFTNTSSTGITATLEIAGDVFTVGGSANAYTFTAGQNSSYVLNYNSRELINGYANTAATFYLYRYVAQTPVTRTYTKVNSSSDVISGDQYLMVYNNAQFMLPLEVSRTEIGQSGSNKEETRVGFELETPDDTDLTAASITGAYQEKEWTLTKNADGTWLLGAGGKYARLEEETDLTVTARLVETGYDTFTMGVSGSTFTFSDGTYCLHYNSRRLVNGYTKEPVYFTLYRYEENSCEHANTEIRNQSEASATANGNTGDTYCKDCGKLIEKGRVMHQLVNGVTFTSTNELKDGYEYVIASSNSGTAKIISHSEDLQRYTTVTISNGKVTITDPDAMWSATNRYAYSEKRADGVRLNCGDYYVLSDEGKYSIETAADGYNSGWRWSDGTVANVRVWKYDSTNHRLYQSTTGTSSNTDISDYYLKFNTDGSCAMVASASQASEVYLYAYKPDDNQVIDNAVTSVYLGSDRHNNTTAFEKLLKEEAEYANSHYGTSMDTVILGGDTFDGESTLYTTYASLNDFIKSKASSVQSIYYTPASHDASTSDYSSATITGPIDKGDYWVYSVAYDWVHLSQSGSTSTAKAQATAFLNWVNNNAGDKPIIVVSHVPLHERRGDNYGASAWLAALNEAGAEHDILFFWGHNHSGHNYIDQNGYYTPVGGQVKAPGDAASTTLTFTYMNCGYINMERHSNLITIAKNKIYVDVFNDEMHLESYTINRINKEEPETEDMFLTISGEKGTVKNKIKFVGKVHGYPDSLNGYEVTGHGIVYINSSKLGNNELTLSTSGRTKVSFTAYSSEGTFSYTIRSASAATKYTARAWIAYEENGETKYLYSDPITVTYSGL